MADNKTVRLTHTNGATVAVPSAKAESLLRRGFTEAGETKTAAKKSTSKTAK